MPINDPENPYRTPTAPPRTLQSTVTKPPPSRLPAPGAYQRQTGSPMQQSTQRASQGSLPGRLAGASNWTGAQGGGIGQQVSAYARGADRPAGGVNNYVQSLRAQQSIPETPDMWNRPNQGMWGSEGTMGHFTRPGMGHPGLSSPTNQTVYEDFSYPRPQLCGYFPDTGMGLQPRMLSPQAFPMQHLRPTQMPEMPEMPQMPEMGMDPSVLAYIRWLMLEQQRGY